MKTKILQSTPWATAKRCGAKCKRTGLSCKGMAIRSKNRCRMHGGKSTGAKTKAGKEKCHKANWKHGNRSQLTIHQIKFAKHIIQQANELINAL